VFVLEKENSRLFKSVEQQNLVRQYELLINCIEIGLTKGAGAVDKYLLWTLNHVAVANIAQHAGRFRKEPVYVGTHVPPHFKDVDSEMDRCITTLQENWFAWSETELAAYALWRVNWIHPFIEGNGRTARALCYYLLCVRVGSLLPGKPILPERIRATRNNYVNALETADQAWKAGHLDVTAVEDYLAGLVEAQLQSGSIPTKTQNAT